MKHITRFNPTERIINPQHKFLYRHKGARVHRSPPGSPLKPTVVEEKTPIVLPNGTVVYSLKRKSRVKGRVVKRLVKPMRTPRRNEVSSSTKSDTSSDNTCCSDKTDEI
jgi:hypothetical protein